MLIMLVCELTTLQVCLLCLAHTLARAAIDAKNFGSTTLNCMALYTHLQWLVSPCTCVDSFRLKVRSSCCSEYNAYKFV